MTRAAAARATAAADALLDWLREQPPPVFCPARRGPPDSAPAEPQPGATDASPRADAVAADAAGPQPGAGAADMPQGAAVAGRPAKPAGGGGLAYAPPVGTAAEPPAAAADGRESVARTATASGTGDASGAVPLRLAHTDWLYHHLVVAGPDAALAAFQAAAAGAGVVPWHLDLDRIEEDCFHRLVAPPPPQQRSLSLAGARIVAGQLRDAVARRHDLALSRVGHSRACPFDLHALVPVPGELLRRGPDDPLSLAWLWQHWGTTQALRHVTAETAVAGQERRCRPEAGGGEFQLRFWSADWSPWRALAAIAARWSGLRFDLRPSYDPP